MAAADRAVEADAHPLIYGTVSLVASESIVGCGRPPCRAAQDPGFWRVQSGKRLSKKATPEPRAQSGGGHAALGLLELVRLLARQAAREHDGARSSRMEESNDG
jgi:hypothetical protein